MSVVHTSPDAYRHAQEQIAREINTTIQEKESCSALLQSLDERIAKLRQAGDSLEALMQAGVATAVNAPTRSAKNFNRRSHRHDRSFNIREVIVEILREAGEPLRAIDLDRKIREMHPDCNMGKSSVSVSVLALIRDSSSGVVKAGFGRYGLKIWKSKNIHSESVDLPAPEVETKTEVPATKGAVRETPAEDAAARAANEETFQTIARNQKEKPTAPPARVPPGGFIWSKPMRCPKCYMPDIRFRRAAAATPKDRWVHLRDGHKDGNCLFVIGHYTNIKDDPSYKGDE